MSAKKTIGWIFGIIGVLILMVVVGGFFLLRSSGFHRYVLAKIIQQAEEATGGRVEIQNYDFHLTKLSADVYGLVIHGTEPSNQQPLLTLDRLYINLKIVSLLHHKVDLNEIIIQHPVVHLISDKNGRSNIPEPNAPEKKSSNTNVFDLGIKHVLLANGEIYYNQERTPMQAELHDLLTEIKYDYTNSRYDGTMSYRNGRLQVGDSKPLPHDLNASFWATPSQFSLSPAELRVGESRARLEAKVTNYANPNLEGSYQFLIHTLDFQPLMKGSPVPAGDVLLSGSLGYQNVAGQPLIRCVTLQGRIDSRELNVTTPQVHTSIRALHGNYKLVNADFTASDLGADLIGGHLGADVSIRHMDTTPQGSLRAVVRAISLRTARDVARSAQLQQMPLTGRIDGVAEASWTGSMKDLTATSDLMLKGAITQKGGNASLVPVDGIVHVDYDGPRNVIALKNTFFRTPKSMIDVYGTVSNHSNLRVQARTKDLHELSGLAAALQAGPVEPTSSNAPKTLNIGGSADFSATVQGPMKSPRINGQLTAQNLQVGEGQFRSLQMGLQANPSGISVRHGSLVAARQGQASFDASIGLRNWKYRDTNPIAANLSVRQMPLTQLQELLRKTYPVTGNLSANITLQGTQMNPEGNGSAQITQAKAYGQRVQNLSLNFKAAGNTVNSVVTVKTPAGGANANLVLYPKTKGYQLQMNVPGINLAQLDAVQQRNAPVNGILSASANGRGTFNDPQLTAAIQIPQLQVRQNTIKDVKAQMNVANHRAELALDSQLLESFLTARGTVNLTGSNYTVATIDTKGIPLGALIALYKPVPSQFQGELEFHASARGPLKDKSRMEAHLVVPVLKASYKQVQIGAVRPIKIDYVNSVMTIAPSEIRGTDTDLTFAGDVPLKGSAPPKLNAKGTVNLAVLKLLTPDIDSSGNINMDVRASGRSVKDLGVQGQLRLQNVTFSSVTAPMGVENLNGLFEVENNQIRITQLAGKLGGGQLTGGGTITYKPQLLMNVAVNAKGVRLRYPEGVRTVLDSNLTLGGTTQSSSLNGRVLIDSLGFTPDFDLSSFMGQLGGGPTAPPTGQGFTQNLKLNVALQSTSQLSVVNPQLSLQGQVNLRIVGTAANPVIVGRTEFTGGDLFFQNKRYTLQRGIINFINPNQTEPVLNVVITTIVQQYNLTLTFLGPMDKLRTSYTSDPPLPPVDVINLLARGSTTEESSPGNMSANSVIAQGLAGQVSSRIQKLAGLSSLTIDPTLGGNGTNPSARIAMQQRVTKNFIFTFSTDVTQPQEDIVQGEYQVSKHWSVAATRDQYGGVAFDGKYHTVF